MPESRKTILVVDDDPKIRRLLARCLEADGYDILEAETQAEVDAHLDNERVDLITLDLQLGDENGLSIASRIRETSQIPIIMVTGKGDVIDKVVGLEIGADDYIAKPFHVREVQARVRALLRRSDSGNSGSDAVEKETKVDGSNRLQFDGWTLDPDRFDLTRPDGTSCELTTAEFKLLTLFAMTPKRVLTRDFIMDALFGNEHSPFDRTIDNQVARLRKKIERTPSSPKMLKTIRGVGYMFAADVQRV